MRVDRRIQIYSLLESPQSDSSFRSRPRWPEPLPQEPDDNHDELRTPKGLLLVALIGLLLWLLLGALLYVLSSS